MNPAASDGMVAAFRRSLVGTVKILSIDGGGIRGIIPAMVLAELERLLDGGREKNRALHSYFHLLAGTSTGALIALGLTAPRRNPEDGTYTRTALLRAADLVEIYEEHGLDIFPRNIFSQFQAMRQAFAGKYDAGNFDTVLRGIFEERAVSDALGNLLVTSFDLEGGHPLIIKKRPGRHSPPDPDFLMRDAARGSAAAPTYFQPVRVKALNQDQVYTLIDGGMFANNPAMCAYVEARKIYPRAKRFVILSLGTGSAVRHFPYQAVKNWGFLEWVAPYNGVPMATLMGRGQSDSVGYQLQHLPLVDYIRLEPDLDGCNPAMDDASDKNIKALRKAAARLIETRGQELERIAKLL